MPDDPIAVLHDNPPIPTPVVIPAIPAADRERRPVCEFCACKLTARGEIIEMSDKAKTLRDQGDTIERLTKENHALTRQVSELKAQQTATKSTFFGG